MDFVADTAAVAVDNADIVADYPLRLFSVEGRAVGGTTQATPRSCHAHHRLRVDQMTFCIVKGAN